MTATRTVGSRPSAFELAERALAETAVLRGVVIELGKRIETLEGARVGEDGATPKPLGPNWAPIKKAAITAGYAGESGLRAAIKRAQRNGEPAWWCLRGPRTYIDTDRCPRCG
jgi:hypothetical protein